MAYLSQQMYSPLLHSCIPHVFMLFDSAVLLKGALVLVEVVVADSFSAPRPCCFPLLHLEYCSSTLAILGPEMSLVGKRKECRGWGFRSGMVCPGFIAHSHFHNCPQSNLPLLDSSRSRFLQISRVGALLSAGDPQVRTGATNVTDFRLSVYQKKMGAVVCPVIAMVGHSLSDCYRETFLKRGMKEDLSHI